MIDWLRAYLEENFEIKRTLRGEKKTQLLICSKWQYTAIFAMKRISIKGFMQAVFELDIQNEHENLHWTHFSNCNSVKNLTSNLFMNGMDENIALSFDPISAKVFRWRLNESNFKLFE